MTEYRLVATGEYSRQPSALEGERAVAYRVNTAVEYPKVADAHAIVDGTAAESKRCQLSASHDAVLLFGQRPNSPFALESLAARVPMRVRLTMHGNVKDTRNRIRPWLGRVSVWSLYDARLGGEGIMVRDCRQEDVVSVLGLWARERSSHASALDRPEDVERLIDDSPAALLVAERDGEVVGALIAAWDGWRGNMYRLAVRQGCRREGIGIALTRAGEDYLRGHGARRVTALVAFEDEAAGAFWEAAGYPTDREIGRRVRNL
jgi:ribosomal protein S18 acetylase RimI-like enzyme